MTSCRPTKKTFTKVGKKDLDDLKSSIEISGILDPPSVCKADGDKYRIISGHRRCEAVRQLVKEGRKDLRMVPCFIRSPQSAEMEELELIWANATSRVLSSPELAQQAARVEELLYQLKEQGVEFPGRMRDHVAQACKISRTKLANLHAIQTNLRAPLLDMWRKGTLNDAQALELQPARRRAAGHGWQACSSREQGRSSGICSCPKNWRVRKSRGEVAALWCVPGRRWPYLPVCSRRRIPAARFGQLLRYVPRLKCCWTCRNGRTASGYNACDSMCSRAKAARTAANQQQKDKETAARERPKLKSNRRLLPMQNAVSCRC
ncbi:MAG: ParB/RepB/Spo0J family partition protein [Acutalibacteraceae bacterium]